MSPLCPVLRSRKEKPKGLETDKYPGNDYNYYYDRTYARNVETPAFSFRTPDDRTPKYLHNTNDLTAAAAAVRLRISVTEPANVIAAQAANVIAAEAANVIAARATATRPGYGKYDRRNITIVVPRK